MRKLKILVANPSGNITVFVLTPCERKDYLVIAQALLAHKELKGEQVGFVKSCGLKNVLEMGAMEFCGNAGRAFALYCAREQGLKEPCIMHITETGTTEILRVEVHPETGYTKIKMPAPLEIKYWKIPELSLVNKPIMVNLGGIVHVVLRDEKPSQETFAIVKKSVYTMCNPAALGTVFLNTHDFTMVPRVYASGVNSTYWEGSCGSGSQGAAVALAWLEQSPDGEFCYKLKQPAGTITASVKKKNGKIFASYIEGNVELGTVQEIVL